MLPLRLGEVFKKFNKLGSPVEVVGTPNEDFRVPIPCKLVGITQKLIWTEFISLFLQLILMIHLIRIFCA
jgi:hypothetical protein